jgi:hypothetical protein
MSGARDSMTTEIRALPNGSEPAEKGLRLGLRQGRPASRRGAPRRPTSTAATGSKAPLRPEPTMTPASRHGVESAARPLRQCEKEGNGRRDAPARERAGRASNRAGRCGVSLSEHRPGGRADMIDRSQPRLLFQARSLPMRAFALPGPLCASEPSGVGWPPDSFWPAQRLAFPLRLPYMARHSTGGFYAAPDPRRRSGGEVPSLHMIRRGSTGQGQAIHGSA